MAKGKDRWVPAKPAESDVSERLAAVRKQREAKRAKAEAIGRKPK